MNDPVNDSVLDALLARARAMPRDTAAAEFAFETRLLARLRAHRPAAVWGMLTWRLMPLFAAIALVLMCWQAQASTETRETAQVASLANVDPVDLGEGN